MANNVKIIYNNQSYSFPIIEGSENEKAIDIKQLRSKTGFITYDPGYKNTGHCISNITYLDGENGILRYRGYSIDELCKKTTFLEVCYLLIFGELPTKQQLDKFQFDINKESLVDEHVKEIFHSFPKSAHPMGVLSSLTSAMIAFSPKNENKLSLKESAKSENDKILYNSTVKLLAKFPILSSWTLRKIKGLPLNYSSDRFNYVENIAYLMFAKPNQEYVQNDIVVNALNSLLILHADHEQNCSTSTVRIVGSSYAGLFASISAGISALWGRLHGGANQAVIEMLELIKNDNSNINKYIDKAKDKNDPFRLMGFGHRVYKNFDPRAKIIKKATDQVLNDLGIDDPVLDIAKEIESKALNDPYFIEKKLYPNVDFYSGIIYRALGIPTDMFTVIFALGRIPGWIAQWKEMRESNSPIGRPRQLYNGPNERSIK
ncbi:MAG TPA: citrate synthase [Flavobacteriaceae bacterium]|jgi:citrate synthase|nr:citrate synthase [Flavobacteriaceae bacterium]|tara:strand:+ start:11051 stop:12346 length:1296 start_codon:yes stop_codon:yes gene_type:complete